MLMTQAEVIREANQRIEQAVMRYEFATNDPKRKTFPFPNSHGAAPEPTPHTGHTECSGRMDESEDDLRKVATSILLEELIEDDESVVASVSGSVSINTLTAMATAALEVDEGHSEGKERGRDDAEPVDHTYSQQNPADPLLKLYWQRDIQEYTTSEFRHFFRMRRSTFEVSAVILPFLLSTKKAVVGCSFNSRLTNF